MLATTITEMKFKLETFNRNITDEELIRDLIQVAEKLGKANVTTREYNANGNYKSVTIRRRFKNWGKALEKANLRTVVNRNISEIELFKNIEEVWIKLGRQPKSRDMQLPLSKYTTKPYKNRFETWRKALEKFVDFINSEEIETGKIIETKTEIVSRHKTKRDINNWRLRFLVMRRDNFKCVVCGRNPATDSGIILHVDHILAWDKGGETIYENLQTLCSVCNIGKSNLNFKTDGNSRH